MMERLSSNQLVSIIRQQRSLSVGKVFLYLCLTYFSDISLTQDKEVGDGTTSVTVFAAELLKEAEIMIGQHIHPQTIVSGYRKALKIAQKTLKESAINSGLAERDRSNLLYSN